MPIAKKPTPFVPTAAKPDYKIWDLFNTKRLIVEKNRDESQQKGC
jgi:hypothetical protein